MNTYYDKPTQVAFLDDEGLQAGIAYKDEIICLCCGGILKISEVTDIKKLSWVSLTEETLGGYEYDYGFNRSLQNGI